MNGFGIGYAVGAFNHGLREYDGKYLPDEPGVEYLNNGQVKIDGKLYYTSPHALVKACFLPRIIIEKGLINVYPEFDIISFIKGIVNVTAKTVVNSATKGTNVVYQGLDAAGTVRYVGITEREAAVRFAEHLNSVGTGKELLRYEVIEGATGLSRTGARVWEQTLINQYGLGKNGGLLLNKINSIAPKNWSMFGL